ncbi:MAG: hypothetical protein LBC75_00115 [Fibromonadaceae bacterium]|jgi:hypothetical protein|nr:hypothetical protein [Fibromonadaceae bacterium]
MKVDVQKFMELRNSAIERSGTNRNVKVSPKTADNKDWRSLLESKRKEIGLEPAAPVAKKHITKQVKVVAADFDGTMEERVSALRERSAEGLPVRERGNFIDVRA